MKLATATAVLAAAAATTSVAGETSSHQDLASKADATTSSRTSTILSHPRLLSRRPEKKRLTSLLVQRKRKTQQMTGNEIVVSASSPVGILKNEPIESGDETNIEECDPSVFDVGVLSCGLGRYCAASTESSLGGVCKNDPETSSSSSSSTITMKYVDRDLQDRNILDDVSDFCFGTTVGLTCDTCQLDAALFTGQINCTYAETCYNLGGLCPEETDMVTFCDQSTVEANLTGPDEYTYRICYNLQKPKNFTYCITYTYVPDKDPTCEIVVDGTKCNSCTPTSSDANAIGFDCREFDCENTMLAVSSASCDYSLLEAFSADYLYSQLPCEGGCNLCGDGGTMDSPDDNFVLAGGAVSNCFAAQLSAMTGEYSGRQCFQASSRVGNCDCQEAPPSAAPSEPSSGNANNGGARKMLVSLAAAVASASLLALAA